MANQFLNAQEYANVMLLLLKNKLVTGRLVDGRFKDQVTDENGLSISVKRPPRFVAKSGAALQTQDIVTGSVNVAVNQYKNVHISVGDLEYVQSYNALLQNETVKSAASTLAHDVDSFLQRQTLGFHSWVGNGATLNSVDPTKAIVGGDGLLPAFTRLQEQGAPDSDISGTVTNYDSQKIRGGMLSSFTTDLNTPALLRSRIPAVDQIDWYATQQCPAITTGTRSSTSGQVNGGAQNVNYRDVKTTMQQTFDFDTLTGAATGKAGEVFTIAGVYAWDWRKGQKLDYLQQFTLLADFTAAGGVVTDAVISPPIIVQGTNDGVSTDANTAFATVDSIPADGAAITFVGAPSTTLRVRAAWQKRAISLVSARLHMPFTGVASFATDPGTGIAIRYWRGSDISTGAHVHRWDMIYGGAVMDPFLGTRIGGAGT